MNHELATTSTHEMMTAFKDMGISAEDIVIPKILACQGLSKMVLDGTAKFGDFVDSVNQTVLGSISKPLEVIPFHFNKHWVVFNWVENGWKYKGAEIIGAHNDKLPYEETVEMEDGKKIKVRRDRSLNIFVLLPSSVEEGMPFPYTISFRRTSAKAGQKMLTTMAVKNSMRKSKNSWEMTPASSVMEFFGRKEQNDKGTFVQLDVKDKRLSTKKEVEAAMMWREMLGSKHITVDHSDEAPTQTAESGAHSDQEF